MYCPCFLHGAACGQHSGRYSVCLLQEQNEALLAQLHARERTIRDLMQKTGASAADVTAFVSDIDARCAEQKGHAHDMLWLIAAAVPTSSLHHVKPSSRLAL